MKRLTGIMVFYILVGTVVSVPAQTISGSPILSEFICNPTGALETEWIELYNPTETAFDLSRFQIGDALGLRDISDTGLYLDAGEYIVLAQDPEKFLQFYSRFNGRVTAPKGWQTLNNYDGDAVRLADYRGWIVDSVWYDAGFPDNRSWERFINVEGESYWGESFSPTGSTPGESNAFYYPRAGNIDLTVAPDPFSPDGDGFEDETVISFGMPEADQFELVIYDIAGRKVRTFYEDGASIPGEIIWDGRDDEGRSLPIGIYIIYARVEGGVSMAVKKTVVIAR
jgi:hypothetical protein